MNTDNMTNETAVPLETSIGTKHNRSSVGQLLEQLLSQLVLGKKIEDVAKHFGLMVLGQFDTDNQVKNDELSLVVLLATLAMDQMLKQHTCCFLKFTPIKHWLDTAGPELSGKITIPDHQNWMSVLSQYDDLIMNVDELDGFVPNTLHITPLVMWQGRLYLYRYFVAEWNVSGRVCKALTETAAIHHVDHTNIENQISKAKQFVYDLFEATPMATDEPVNWQLKAVLNSLATRFSVISGGPGTGKTTTVIKLLASLIYDHQQSRFEHALKIAVCAPTGKAALRLEESIGNAIDNLAIDRSIKAEIPTTATTIHRLLGARGRGQFKHNELNQIPIDILLVDEASMIDVTLMAKLFGALPSQCRVILVGDRQQLASVEAGNVLADFYQAQTHIELPYLVELKKSWRFDASSAIGQLAKAINEGNPSQVEQVFVQDETASQALRWYQNLALDMDALIENVVTHYIELTQSLASVSVVNEADKVKAAFKKLHQLQILCCIRKTDAGTAFINFRIHQRLVQKNIIPNQESHYVGRPIMISSNAYHLKLFNGDIGIQMIDPESGLLMTYFQNSQHGFIKYHCQRLPSHESVYAMTVHKSQGSEFEHTILVLPTEDDSIGITTREIVYTGLTRSKKKFTLLASKTALYDAIAQLTKRQSGLAAMLEQRIAQK